MTSEFNPQELEQLIDAGKRDLGPADRWRAPDGYPLSLALSVIDSVFSINALYEGVVNVIRRYGEYRAKQSGNADNDGVLELMGSFEHLGGPDNWADHFDNHWRTSTRSGILKSDAVLQEIHLLANHGVWTTADLHTAAVDGQLDGIESDWLTVTGHNSGISWHYVLILARPQEKVGAPADLIKRYADAVIGVKPDRMVKRYVAKATGVTEPELPNRKAGALVKAAAKAMGCDVYAIDHVIWRYQSKRLHQKD